MKKHESQMTKSEIHCLIGRLKKIGYQTRLSNHTLQRLEERNMKPQDVFNVFKKYKIMEFENDLGGSRVLLRSRDPVYKGKDDVCIVVNLINGDIVSAYTDVHKDNSYVKEDLSNYNSSMDIKSFLRFYPPSIRRKKK